MAPIHLPPKQGHDADYLAADAERQTDEGTKSDLVN
jgi:hypothetical protein